MKCLVLFAPGFETSEALTTCDVLFRAHIEVIKVSVSDSLEVTSQEGITVLTDYKYNQIDLADFDMLFIPGGKACFEVLNKLKIVEEIIVYFVKHEKWICAICAAPYVIGRLGYFKGHNYTCYPGCEQSISEGTYLDHEVVVSNKFITGKGPYYSLTFALKVIQTVLGEEEYLKVKAAMEGNNG